MLSILLASFVLAPEAGAGGFDKWRITPESFFDYTRAERYWAELRTRDQLDAAWEPCDAGAYKALQDEFRWRDKEEVEPEFADSPDAEEIRACYDLQQTYWVFDNAWRKCYGDPSHWTERDHLSNIFTKSCDDVPDWRQKK
ncbi:hypothetical protein [Roseospira visakhapatnamensis]|uniref:Uncharacterized protein n=1 Tax=Roseospira visakhapatnamensis TaxID=390880 RepID=A0A7W6WBL0_9PROT|nr:hypothetical protein [Roseospira visakhapatnamensis]MBB4267636.1 hypothetical protein [Roseospira visakhapatnamensis]